MKHVFSTLFLAFVLLTSNAQNIEKKWTFSHKDGRERSFTRGQKITVKWDDSSGKWILKGRLADLTADSLILSLKDTIASVAKKDIVEISARRQNFGRKFVGAFIILAGILWIGFFVLLQVASDITRQDYQLRAGERERIWPWAFVGFGIIALGIGYLHSPLATPDPFGHKWALKEVLPKIENIP